MANGDLVNALQYLWQEASAYSALHTIADQAFTQGYEQMDEQMLIHDATYSAMNPEQFGVYTVSRLPENSPILTLGSETLGKIASECIWKAIRKRNLELTVLTRFQQGLVIAQKNCQY